MRLSRTDYIGGHDAGAIVGEHPFLTSGDVYAKCALKHQQDLSESPAIRRGLICEPGMIEHIKKTTGQKLVRDLHVVDKNNIFAGTLDCVETETGVIHDVTTTTSYNKSWSNGAAVYKEIQLQWYMGLVENFSRSVSASGINSDTYKFPVTDHAVLTVFYVDTGDIQSFTVWRDEKRIKTLRDASEDFWFKHVQTMTPPEEMSDDAIKIVYPSNNGKQIEEVAEEIRDAAKVYATARDNEKKWGDVKKKYGKIIKGFLKDHDGCKWDTGNISWKQNKAGKKIDYEAMSAELCRQLGISFDELKEKFTKEKPGARVLRVKSDEVKDAK